jgi:hypothetical protein
MSNVYLEFSKIYLEPKKDLFELKESKEKVKIYPNKTHTAQRELYDLTKSKNWKPWNYMIDKRPNPELNYKLKPDVKYIERANTFKSTSHHGQRKLCLSEIQMFNKDFQDNFKGKFPDSSQKATVVYVGSAEGYHLPVLFNEYENYVDNWILYDPNYFKFDMESFNQKKVLVDRRNQYFTDETAKELKKELKKSHKGKRIYFICDIRAINSNEGIRKNMLEQRDWVLRIKPDVSFLKMRYLWSYEGDKYPESYGKYLPGKMFMQIFHGPTSTEMRLLTYRKQIEKKEFTNYSHVEMERKNFWHNIHTRVCDYSHPGKFPAIALGYCNCYDCTGESWILNDYLKCKNIPCTKDNFRDLVKKIDKFSLHTVAEYMPYTFYQKYAKDNNVKCYYIRNQCKWNIKK